MQLPRFFLAMSALFALTSVAANAASLNPQPLPPGQQHQATQQNQGHVNTPNLGGMNQGPSQFHPVSLPVMAPGTNRHEQLPSSVSDFRKEPSHLPNAPLDPKLPVRIINNEPSPKPVDPIHTADPIRRPDPIRTTDPIRKPIEPIQTPEPTHSHGPVRAPEPQRNPDHGDQGKNHGDQGENAGQNHGNKNENAGKNDDKNQGDQNKNTDSHGNPDNQKTPEPIRAN